MERGSGRRHWFARLMAVALLIVAFDFNVCGQSISVKSMELLMDPMTENMQRKDANGNCCALIKVPLPVDNCSFEGNVVGDTKYVVNEYWVYLTPGSKFLQIKCPGYFPFRIDFRDYGIDGVKSKRIYSLALDIKGADNSKIDVKMPSDMRKEDRANGMEIKYSRNISINELLHCPLGFVEWGSGSLWKITEDEAALMASLGEQEHILKKILENNESWIGCYMIDSPQANASEASTLILEGLPLWQVYPIVAEESVIVEGWAYITYPFYSVNPDGSKGEQLSVKETEKKLQPLIKAMSGLPGFKKAKREDYIDTFGYCFGQKGSFFKNDQAREFVSVTYSGNYATIEIRKF